VPTRRLRLHDASARTLRQAFDAVRTEFAIPGDFADDVLSAATAAAAAPRLPELDRTDIEFVTIDPPGSLDLDQAVHIARDATGYRVSYAIADVAAFVTVGDALDKAAQGRGVTFYAPDGRRLLYPSVLSEGAASLLPGEVRPALLWSMQVDASGECASVEVVRARVRSREQFSYTQVQADLDTGRAIESLELLAEVGTLRERRERARGAVNLPLPEQDVVASPDGRRLSLEFRAPEPVEGWNAQISLMTGMAAADLMLYAQVGILRTLPPADPHSLRMLHRIAKAMGVVWPAEMTYPDFIHFLDPANPRHAAIVTASTAVLRGSGYTAFDGEVPAQPEHSALASGYAHVTAPLRRLVDRYAGEVCVAICAGLPVPASTRAALPDVAAAMQRSDRLSAKYDRACVGAVEAAVLAGSVGQLFEGVVVELDAARPASADDAPFVRTGTVQLSDPAVMAKVSGADLPLGENTKVRLTEADVTARRVRFELA
jgi:exoribonuclease R